MKLSDKIYIAGHRGMVGSAIVRKLENEGYTNLVLRTRQELDLLNQSAVEQFFATVKPEYVFLAAAKVGGILANDTYRAQFIYENLQIQNNVIHQSYVHGVKKLLFLGSSCIYPKNCPQPIKEEYLLTGPLEPTNEPYAIAKIAGIKMCQAYRAQYGCNFISAMPTNLYGPNDNYDLETSHVMAALIRKFYLASRLERDDWDAIRADLNKRPANGVDGSANKEDMLKILAKHGIRITDEKPVNDEIKNSVSLTLWGTGKPRREFLHVDDMADACTHIMKKVTSQKLYEELGQTHINIGTGKDINIKELAEIIKESVNFHSEVNWDRSKLDGTFRKQLDVGLMYELGWKPKTELRKCIKEVFDLYKSL